jgi:adenylate kinase family enzyme
LEYKRIVILGSSGSGKSYLSKEIAKITGLPLIHLDFIFFLPGWKATPDDEWIEKLHRLAADEKWIIEGVSKDKAEILFKTADLIIFLDVNRFRCIYQFVKRKGNKRNDIPQYLDEKFDLPFLKCCLKMLLGATQIKSKVIELHRKYPEKPFIALKNKKASAKLLADLKELFDKKEKK